MSKRASRSATSSRVWMARSPAAPRQGRACGQLGRLRLRVRRMVHHDIAYNARTRSRKRHQGLAWRPRVGYACI